MQGSLHSVPDAGPEDVRHIVEAHGGRLTYDAPRAHARARQLTWTFANGGQLAWRELHWIGECVIHAVDVPPAVLDALPIAQREELVRRLDSPEPLARIRALRQLVVTGATYADVEGGLRAMLASPLLEERQCVLGALRAVRWPEIRDLLAARLPHEDVLAPQIRTML